MAQLTRRQMLAGAGAAGVLVAFGGDKALARELPRQARWRSNPFTLGVASGRSGRRRRGAVDTAGARAAAGRRRPGRPRRPVRCVRGGARTRACGGSCGRARPWPRPSSPIRCTSRSRARARPRVLLPVRCRRLGDRTVGRTRTAPAPRRAASTGCASPSPPARTGSDGYYTAYRHMADGGPRPRASTSATTSTSTASTRRPAACAAVGARPLRRRDARRSSSYRLQPRAVQDRPRPAARPRPLPVRGHVGRPRGRERLRRADIPRTATPPAMFRAPARRRLPGVLRAPAAPRAGAARPRRDAAALPPPALRRARRVPRARHPPVPHRPPVRRRRAAALRRPRSTRPRPMLGREQERWLREASTALGARWNVLGQQVLMAELDHRSPAERRGRYWHDALGRLSGGAPAPARRHAGDARLRNPVVITGDWHSTFVNDFKLDFDDPASPDRGDRVRRPRRSPPTATGPSTGRTTAR